MRKSYSQGSTNSQISTYQKLSGEQSKITEERDGRDLGMNYSYECSDLSSITSSEEHSENEEEDYMTKYIKNSKTFNKLDQSSDLSSEYSSEDSLPQKGRLERATIWDRKVLLTYENLSIDRNTEDEATNHLSTKSQNSSHPS